ncbi:TniB family NTP-binding protein [Cytobacillus solani]|uniref:TniB family NTP-binding protein n=1 Tax=Cytobacillus solani TaxID=1637975 RepID=UPI0011510D60|nr:TniB family NTP-binding protein [Cytobacillus solani]
MNEQLPFKRLNGIPASKEDVRNRREHVKRIVIAHPNYSDLLTEIEEVHYYSKGSVKPDSLFLSGEAGVGKSTLLEDYTSRFPRDIVNNNTVIPVLYSTLPVGATPKTVAARLLYSLGDPAYDKGTEISQTSRLLNFIKKCKVELIIIDEFQHLLDRDTKHILNKASEWVKSFCDEAGVPIILCGFPESKKIFKFNSQLDRRFLTKLSMEGFRYYTKEEQIEFRAFLKSIDEQLPFIDRSSLASKQLADKFFYATNGIPSHVNKILYEATGLAAKSGNDSIDENHLYDAFNKIEFTTRPFVTNPFTVKNFNIVEAFELEKLRSKDAN